MPSGSAVRNVRPWQGTSGNEVGRPLRANQKAARSRSSSLATLKPIVWTPAIAACRSTIEW